MIFIFNVRLTQDDSVCLLLHIIRSYFCSMKSINEKKVTIRMIEKKRERENNLDVYRNDGDG